ncbi:MAG: HAMP domain-containing histidine kinase, partial [Planctomycetes bacterium]|nr:HAMP domain-containing histidine kinase [Planctomycetota bacterium]
VGDGEVGALARELEAMRARLVELDRRHRQDERLATLGLFTATIAHEVRNPLSAVRLTVQLAARAPGADARLAPLTDELDRLDLTVDELLGFARGMNVERQPCDLAVVAADVLRLLRRQADHAGIALALVPAPASAAPVQADPRRLRQLLLNLLLNALQARRDGRAASRVAVELAADGFAVADDGPGVDPALVPRLFDAFTSDRVGGTGLGLNLARAIAEAHGATLAYEPGNPGARFVLRGLVAAVPVVSD